MKPAMRYAILALTATIANIGAQDLVIRGYVGAGEILISIAIGFGIGPVAKCLLAKRYIFSLRDISGLHDVQIFVTHIIAMALGEALIFRGAHVWV
jgi:hypothetical protein